MPTITVTLASGGLSLRQIRTAAGLSLSEVALFSEIDKAHLSRVERGKKSLSTDSLVRVLRVLGEHLIADIIDDLMAVA